MRKKTYDDADERFIMANCKDFTAVEFTKILKLGIGVVYMLGAKVGVTFKKHTNEWRVGVPHIKKKKDEKTLFCRPKSVYNQIPSPYGIASQIREL